MIDDLTGSAAIVSDPLRTPVTAQRRECGGVFLRSSRSFIALSDAEFSRLVEFVQDAPQLGHMQVFNPS
jgi:hypothetical protein